MTLQIREATPADAMLLNALGYRIYRAHFEHLWESKSELEAFLASEYSLDELEQSLNEQAVCWYVAETDRPIGFAKVTYESSIPDTICQGCCLTNSILILQTPVKVTVRSCLTPSKTWPGPGGKTLYGWRFLNRTNALVISTANRA